LFEGLEIRSHPLQASAPEGRFHVVGLQEPGPLLVQLVAAGLQLLPPALKGVH